MEFEALAPNISRNKKILITGHSGFKGTWLTLLLEQLNFEVQGISLPPSEYSLYSILRRSDKIQESFVDLRDREAIKRQIQLFKPNYIFHLAAQPLVLESYRNPVETFETNVMGTANLLDALYKNENTEAIVVSTTDKVYKNENSGKKFIESDSLIGKDPYSASKVGTESVIAAWRQISKTSNGPKLSSVRAGNVIGGGDLGEDRLIPDIIRSIIDKSPLVIRNPRNTRPWQHALDPLMGYVLTLSNILEGNDSPAFNFGPTESSLAVSEVLEIAIDVIGPIDIEYQETGNAELESQLLDLDSSRARKELGWNPAWNQEDAIKATMHWWKTYLNSPERILEVTLGDITHRLSGFSSTS